MRNDQPAISAQVRLAAMCRLLAQTILFSPGADLCNVREPPGMPRTSPASLRGRILRERYLQCPPSAQHRRSSWRCNRLPERTFFSIVKLCNISYIRQSTAHVSRLDWEVPTSTRAGGQTVVSSTSEVVLQSKARTMPLVQFGDFANSMRLMPRGPDRM